MKTALRKTLTFFLAVSCTALMITGFCTLTAKASYDPAADVISAINAERTVRALPALVTDGALTEAAMIRSSELPGHMSHTRPHGLPWYTVNSAVQYGETIGYEIPVWNNGGMQSAITSMWMHSPTHSAVLLSPSFRSIGVAFTVSADGRVYWAAEFGF